jgi:hypothetical protein
MVARGEAVGGEEAERLAAGLSGAAAKVKDDDGELVSPGR